MTVTVLRYQDAIDKAGDDRAIVLSVSQQYVLLSLTDKLINYPASFYEDYTDIDPLDITDFNDALMTAVLEDAVPPPNPINLEHIHWHINSQNNIGNGLALTIRTTQIMNHFAAQTASAQNDEWFTQSFWIKAGIPYIFEPYGVKTAASGIIAFELRKKSDNSVLASMSQDMYSAAAVDNFKFQLGYTPTIDTEVYLRGKMTTKNASSSGYGCALTCIMVRT